MFRSSASGFTLNTRATAAQRRREHIWAWVSLGLLILCWDATLRLDQHVSLPRVRIAHAAELEPEPRAGIESHLLRTR